MKFMCECGHKILDISDSLSFKAQIIPDQDWFNLLNEIDKAIEKSGPTEKDKENAVIQVSRYFLSITNTIYQCQNCGNVFFAKKNSDQLEMFRGSNKNVDKNLLQSNNK